MSGNFVRISRNGPVSPLPQSMDEARRKPDDWRLFASSKHVVRDVDGFRKPAFEHVGIGQKIVSIRISRIEREGSGEIALGFAKVVVAAIDVTGENKKRRAVWQTRSRNCEFFLRAIVVAQTSEVIIAPGEMRLSRVGAKPQRVIERSFGERNAVRGGSRSKKKRRLLARAA